MIINYQINSMQQKLVKLLGGLGIMALIVTGCSKDKDKVANEEELITTVALSFTEPENPTNSFTVVFRDVDGEGGNPPSEFGEIVLKPNTTYVCSVSLLNESVSPSQMITKEIEEEADDHEFFFLPEGAIITITKTDMDSRNLPLGLRSSWVTGAASTGTVRVVLKHKPGNKAAGDSVTKGDTDIDLSFTTKVQ